VDRFLDAPLPLAFAHRGGAGAGDENTMEAFARAVRLGFRYLETDVQATADGVAVVFHDPDLARMAGRRTRVGALRWADLATVRVGGAAAIPRLDDALAAWPQARYNLDVKADAAVGPALAALARTGAHGRVLLASFRDARLVRMRRALGPAVATSLARWEVARLRLASYTGRARFAVPPGAVAAQVPVRFGRTTVVDRRFVAHAHRLGLQVHVWTVDAPGEMRELLDLGVDGIMTDHPEVLREVYLSRGLWKA
jgi:glycerophosphoryl diester phosphodiesterase